MYLRRGKEVVGGGDEGEGKQRGIPGGWTGEEGRRKELSERVGGESRGWKGLQLRAGTRGGARSREAGGEPCRGGSRLSGRDKTWTDRSDVIAAATAVGG